MKGEAELRHSPSPVEARAARELALLLDPPETDLGAAFDVIERELEVLFAQRPESLQVLSLALSELRGAPSAKLRSAIAPLRYR